MDFKKIIPHLIAIGALLLVSMVFFAPNAFQGKVLPQPDNDKARGMQTEIQNYIKKDGTSPLWTNAAFGGMPSYQLYVKPENDVIRPLVRAPFLWQDMSQVWSQVFAAMLMLYFLLMVLGTDWRVAIFGAVAYGITSYNVDILEAGHSTKMAALAFAPAMLASTVLIFRKNYLLGSGLLAFFMAAQIYVNHLQITYYTFMLIGLYVIAELVHAIRNKDIAHWAKSVGLIGVMVAVGVSTNLAKIWTTYEYGKETIRGGAGTSENDASNTRSTGATGLSKDYVFDWSCGIAESMTILVPHFAGGGSNETFKDTKLYKAVPPESRRGLGSAFYTGDQPFVGTAIYFGAIVCFLFLLGALIVPGRFKWWLLGGGLFMLSLAWGKYFFFNYLLYDYFPFFNKFRAVTMAFGMSQLCFALLAALGLQRMMDADLAVATKQRALYIAAGSTIGLCILAMFFASKTGANDAQLPENLMSTIYADRSSLVSSDVFRSIGFIVMAAGLLWLYLRGTLKSSVTVLAVAALALADHWMICTRTLTSDGYTTKRNATAPPAPEAYDTQILKDKDIHYRVLDLARGGIAGNGTTSYFHKSISGYHAAKMRRFQEVNETYWGEKLGQSLHILGMMNTKYLVSQKGVVMPNPEACGHAWFVKHYDIVPTSKAELDALATLNPRDTAVLEQSEAAPLQGLQLHRDSTDKIDLVHYHPEKMEYEYTASSEQLAVFPEMYYAPERGWKCYLNGQPTNDFFRVNYLLRGMRLPAGQNMKLEMRFEPQSYRTGIKVNLIASLLVLLLIAGGLFFWWKKGAALRGASRLSDIDVPEADKVTGKAEIKKRK